MKLSLVVVLAAIALCCYQADAGTVCPALSQDLVNFFSAPDFLYRRELLAFDLPKQAVEDRIELKQCANHMSVKDRLLINRLLLKIFAKCNE
ncbi:secretoglobin family 1D member-like [Sorex araneus]|uniref:secretoglobin family 1D member-like n=1 Tax=Sorex araneus TaxID=42254 RepID=UPI0024337812|nr:secretoglobin family 1D member-like [Sorex araneus]